MLKSVSPIMVLVLLSLFIPFSAIAENHVVSTSDLQQAVQTQSLAREQSLQQVKAFFGSPETTAALKQANIDSKQLQQAVSTLNSEELERLAAQTQQVQSDIAGGGLTVRQTTYVILAVTLIAVLIILQ